METDQRIVHVIQKTPTEQIQMAWRLYKDRQYADIRLWYRSENEDEMRPTKRGVSLPLELWPDFQKGIAALDQVIAASASGDRHSEKGC